ncbi:MAG: hypothetical protein JWO03_271 [Bacteroidetes bacterium]|nr:hypothetical protein [Bacteroidota bacterium]
MKKCILIAMALSMALFACRTKHTYSSTTTSPPASSPSSNDNQPYQPAAANYSVPVQLPPSQQPPAQQAPPQQQYSDPNQYSSNTQVYSNQQYNDPEADQYYTTHQQTVNYGAPSYQTFYDELSPYGSWVNYGSYGYVWVPAQGADFRPYATNGHWVYTQYGWTWVSGYHWGWATFHYGRWLDEPGYGWMWVPGNTWGPAWVTWGSYNGYYGWAPIGPNVNYYEGYRPPVQNWNFCPQNHIADNNVNNYVVNHNTNTTIINNNVTNIVVINNQTTINNNRYNTGPEVNNVERATGHKIAQVTVNETSKPVAANSSLTADKLTVYKPAISTATSTKTAPSRVVPITEVKTVNSTAVHGIVKPNTFQPNTVTPVPAGHNNPNNPSNPYQSIPRTTDPNKNVIKEQPRTEPQRPAETRPAQQPPIRTEPQRPVESRPVQQQPRTEPQRPVQTRPVQQQPRTEPQRPVESRPVQQQPRTEPQRPVESRPVQQQPRTEPQRPVESRPAQQQPRTEPQRPVQQRPVQPRQTAPVQHQSQPAQHPQGKVENH